MHDEPEMQDALDRVVRLWSLLGLWDDLAAEREPEEEPNDNASVDLDSVSVWGRWSGIATGTLSVDDDGS